jgi:hypothetical protein
VLIPPDIAVDQYCVKKLYGVCKSKTGMLEFGISISYIKFEMLKYGDCYAHGYRI